MAQHPHITIRAGSVYVNGEYAGSVEHDDECSSRWFALDPDGNDCDDDTTWYDSRQDAIDAVIDAYEGI
jgi:hypothetical protein